MDSGILRKGLEVDPTNGSTADHTDIHGRSLSDSVSAARRGAVFLRFVERCGAVGEQWGSAARPGASPGWDPGRLRQLPPSAPVGVSLRLPKKAAMQSMTQRPGVNEEQSRRPGRRELAAPEHTRGLAFALRLALSTQ